MTDVVHAREIHDDYLIRSDIDALVEDMPFNSRVYVRDDDGNWIPATDMRIAYESEF